MLSVTISVTISLQVHYPPFNRMYFVFIVLSILKLICQKATPLSAESHTFGVTQSIVILSSGRIL